MRDVPGFAWSNPPENNFVDRLVDEKLRQLRISPFRPLATTASSSGGCTSILTGLLPTADDARHSFIEDPSPDKRRQD